MDLIINIRSVLVLLFLMGAMLFATKAFKAAKAKNDKEKQRNLRMAGILVAVYAVLNILRLYLEGGLF